MKLNFRGRIAVALALLALASISGATGTAFVSIIATGQATVVLTAPDGSTITQTTSSGDAVLAPKASGPHKISVTVGGKTTTGDIIIPDSGQVRVIFNPTASKPFESYVAALESVTVTAQRVEESLQKVPIAVTAISARDTEVKMILNLQQMSQEVPNLYMDKNTGTSSGSRAALRGIGEDESFFTSDTPVGIYVDDIYIPRQTGAMFDLYELERLEVLRGPQGTLYGRNTTAGAIRFISKQPTVGQTRANIEGIFGQFARTDGRGSLNAPLGKKAAVQLAGMVRKHEGYDLNKVNGAKVNDQDIWGVRGSLRLTPSSKFSALVTGDFLRERSTPGFAVAFVPQAPCLGTANPWPVVSSTNPCTTATSFGVGAIDLSQQLDGDSDIHTLNSDLTDPINDLDQKGVSAALSWAVTPALTLKSVTGYRAMTNLLLLDADGRTGNFLGIPAPAFHLYQDQSQNQWSQEFQAQGQPNSHLRYLIGAYFFHEHNQQRTENLIFNPLGRNNYWDTGLNTDSRAGFGNMSYQLSEKLQVTAGGRFTSDTKDFNTAVFRPSGAPLVACVNGKTVVTGGGSRACTATDPASATNFTVAKQVKKTWTAFTPRLAFDYQATPNVLAYASASRGFKSGAFDGRSNSAAAILLLDAVNPERLWGYEAGIKSDLAQNRLRINAALFYNDWKDLQGTGTDPEGNFKRFSLGNVETKGAELEVKTRPTSSVEISGQIGLLRTGFKTINFNQRIECGPVGTGNAVLELKYSPHTSWGINARFTPTTPLLGGHFSIGGNVSHKGKYFQGTCNALANSEDGYTIADASASWENKTGRVRLAVMGENLSDEAYVQGAFAISGLRMVSAYFNPPRRVSFSVRYSYN